MIELMGTVACLLAVVGVVCNNRRLIACFPLWMVSNGLMAAIHAEASIWSLVIRDIVFFVLAIDGWRRWRKWRR